MAQPTLQPGFRFHPTEDELVSYYLKRKVMGKTFKIEAIAEVEIYQFAPWDLPAKCPFKRRDLEWYFFCPHDRKYGNSSRRSRCNDTGYWKTTGKDRTIYHNDRPVGMKKTLIFHSGKAPRGDRTDWVMYEYRLADEKMKNTQYAQDAYVVCKIFEKSGRGPKNGATYGAPFKEEDWEEGDTTLDSATSLAHPSSSRGPSDVPMLNPVLGPLVDPIPEPVNLLLASGDDISPPEYSDTDGILLEQLAEFLNGSPLHSGNGAEMFHSLVPDEKGDEFSGLVTEGSHNESDCLSGQSKFRSTNIYFSNSGANEYGGNPVGLHGQLLEKDSTDLLMPNYLLVNDAFPCPSGQGNLGLMPLINDTCYGIGDQGFDFDSLISDLNEERFLELNDFHSHETSNHTQPPTQPLRPSCISADGFFQYPTSHKAFDSSNYAGVTSAVTDALQTSPQQLIPNYLLGDESSHYISFQNMDVMSNYAGSTSAVRIPSPNEPFIPYQSITSLLQMDGIKGSAPQAHEGSNNSARNGLPGDSKSYTNKRSSS